MTTYLDGTDLRSNSWLAEEGKKTVMDLNTCISIFCFLETSHYHYFRLTEYNVMVPEPASSSYYQIQCIFLAQENYLK